MKVDFNSLWLVFLQDKGIWTQTCVVRRPGQETAGRQCLQAEERGLRAEQLCQHLDGDTLI